MRSEKEIRGVLEYYQNMSIKPDGIAKTIDTLKWVLGE